MNLLSNRIICLTILAIFFSTGGLAQQMDYSPGFKAGKPAEMDKLSFLPGEWEISLFYPSNPGADKANWMPWIKSRSRFKSSFDGSFIIEESDGYPLYPEHDGFKKWEFFAVYSYDRFNKTYRVIHCDNIRGLSDVYTGNLIEDALVLSNVKYRHL